MMIKKHRMKLEKIMKFLQINKKQNDGEKPQNETSKKIETRKKLQK